MIKRGPLRGRTNAALMLGTYGAGQGGILAAQSWLAAGGDLELVGFFGLAFTLATLAYVLVDWGGQILLARHELAEEDELRTVRLFWNLTGARILIAFATLGALGAIGWFTGDAFGNSYLVAAAPALLLGVLNPSGLIDGMHRSGLNGIAAMLPYAFSAVGLFLVADFDPEQQGLVLGAAFSAATAAGLVLQFAVLHGARRLPGFSAPTATGMWEAARDGCHVVLTSLPPLLFFRLEIGVLLAVLGPEQTGWFVYARQLLGVILQSAQFVRRAEFPTLVSRLADIGGLRRAYLTQKASIGIQLIGAFGFVVLGAVAGLLTNSGYLSPVVLLSWSYAIILIPCAIFAATLQIFFAINKAGSAALVTNAITVFVGVLIYPSVVHFGLYGIALVDFALNVLCAAGLIHVLKRSNSRPRTH